MKKYNRFSLKWFIIWTLSLAMAFLVGMNAVYAYFTASTTTTSGDITTGTVKIDSGTLSAGVYESGTSVTITEESLVPGDSVGVKVIIKNTGNADIYVIVKLVRSLTLSGGTTDSSFAGEYWYNLSGTEIDPSATTVTVGASVITASSNDQFVIGYLLDGESYGNEYKNSTITFDVYVYAVQYKNIASATTATELILSNFYQAG